MISAMGFTKNEGTITEVKMNGVSKGTSGVVDLGDVQTSISDLETIRDGASKGATALQSVPEEYVKDAQLKKVSDAVDILNSEIGSLYENKQNIISDLDTIREGAAKGATSVQPSDINEFLTVDDLARVSTSGSYNDLTDKPTIPSEITESTVSD